MGIAGEEHYPLKEQHVAKVLRLVGLLCSRNRKASEAGEKEDGVGELGEFRARQSRIWLIEHLTLNVSGHVIG